MRQRKVFDAKETHCLNSNRAFQVKTFEKLQVFAYANNTAISVARKEGLVK